MFKTSEEWQKEIPQIVVLDPDGWDRSPANFHNSWHVEKITRQEYLNRVYSSTCEFHDGWEEILNQAHPASEPLPGM